MDEETFEKGFKPSKRKATLLKKFIEKITPPEPIKTALKPPLSRKEWLKFFLVRLPILEWVWTYRPSYFVGDIISGITVAIMHIPQGLAYSLLATLPAVYGLYASVVPVVVYSVLGTSKHISVGTFAVVELMIGNAIQRTLNSLGYSQCTGGSGNLTDTQVLDMVVDNVTNATCGSIKIDIALTLALMTGLIMLVLGIMQCGFITIFLSTALVSGYTTGAAIHVFSSQLKHITGINIPRTPGVLSVPKTWVYFFENMNTINPAAAIISIISIIILIIFKISNKLLQAKVVIPCAKYKGRKKGCVKEKIKWPIPIPSQLIVVVVSTFISAQAIFRDPDGFDVDVVGAIEPGVPGFTPPTHFLEYSIFLIQDAFVISIVTYSVTVSLVQTFAREHQYTFDNNQEFLAYGIMNIIGSFFSSFTAAGSLSRSSVQSNAGGKTQLVGLISAVIIVIVLVALGPLFFDLPKCVLASIIWVALYGMFKQFGDIWTLLKVSVWDMSTWLVVFVATVLLGVDLGLGVGVGYSLFCLVLRTILPVYSVLGQVEGTEIYRNKDNFDKISPVPGVLIYRFLGPVCFVNSRVFRARLEMMAGLYGQMAATPKDGCLQQLYQSVRGRSGDYPVHPVTSAEEAKNTKTIPLDTPSSTIGRSQSFQQAVEVDIVSMDNVVSDTQASSSNRSTTKTMEKTEVRIHTVIIDCAPISFLDAVGVKTLETAVLDFYKQNVQVIFASMIKENRDRLRWSGFYKKCGKKWLFPTVQDAVDHAKSGVPLVPRALKKKDDRRLPAIVAPGLPGESPLHLSSPLPTTLQIDEQTEGVDLSTVSAADTVGDELGALRGNSDTESVKDKDA
ncbi:sulfate transporter-like isoform X3 [Halichondria panicea]